MTTTTEDHTLTPAVPSARPCPDCGSESMYVNSAGDETCNPCGKILNAELDLATAPAAEIIADEKARREAEKPPLKNVAEAFQRLAEWTVNNTDDEGKDLVIDAVAALAPHLDKDVAADYFEDLMTAVVALGNAEDGEHPADQDELRWKEQCRDAVDYAAEKLAGVC